MFDNYYNSKTKDKRKLDKSNGLAKILIFK